MTVLRPLHAGEAAVSLEAAWGLAQSPVTSLYPSFADGIKMREEFFRAADPGKDAPGETLVQLSDGEFCGLIRYEALPEDRGINFSAFVSRQPERATEEFLAWAGRRYPGWQVDFGLHEENAAACAVLEKAGWVRTEECRVCALALKEGAGLELAAEGVEPVTARTFPEFTALHDQTEGMYWNSARLQTAYFQENSPWRLTLYRRRGKAVAGLCWRTFGDLAEIFSLDPQGGSDGEAMAALLAQGLAEARRRGARGMYFFCDTDSQARAAQQAGMGLLGRYWLYQGTLPRRDAKLFEQTP